MPETTDATALVRGGAVTVSSALITGAAHTAGGGMPPSETAALFLCLICAAIGYAAGATPTSSSRLSAVIALVLAQGAGHAVLTVVDGHHHGSAVSSQMVAAHAVAIGLGAVAIAGAERGIHRAVSALRRVLPLLGTLVVDDSRIAPPLPVFRVPQPSRILDRSGSGNRGPPAAF